MSTLTNMTGLDALRVLAALDNGGWRLTRAIPASYLTDEANREHAWFMERTDAPYCDAKGTRVWLGETPLDVLNKAEAAMTKDIELYKKRNP